MAKKKFRITEKDFLLANRKASREEEIAQYGKQILFRTIKQKSKKVYDRKRLKKAGINSDDLPLYLSVRGLFRSTILWSTILWTECKMLYLQK